MGFVCLRVHSHTRGSLSAPAPGFCVAQEMVFCVFGVFFFSSSHRWRSSSSAAVEFTPPWMLSRKADAELKFSAQTQPLAPKYSLQFSLLRGHSQQLIPTLHKPFSSSSASSGIFHLPSKTLNFAFYPRAALRIHWRFVCLDEELGFYSNPLWSLRVSNACACVAADNSSGSIASPAVTLSPLLEPFQLSSWPWRRF